MFNYGDAASWMTVAKILTVFALVGGTTYLSWKSKSVTKVVIGAVVCFLAILGLFTFFGAGKVVALPPASEDGHSKMLDKIEPEIESSIEVRAEAKKDVYLKRVDESPKKAREESEEYLNKLLKSSENERGSR